MSAALVLARSALRRYWREIAVLTLLIGLTVVLAAVAGARRSATSLTRFEEYSRSADVEVTVGEATPEQLREFEQSEVVAAVARLRVLIGTLEGQELPTAADLDERFATDVDRPRVVAGREPRVTEPDEIAISETLARQLGTRVGGELQFVTFSKRQVEQVLEGGEEPAEPNGPKVGLHVVGIVRRPLDLAGRGARGGVLVPTPAFLERYGDEVGNVGLVLRVRTHHGASDVPEAVAAARRIFGDSEFFDVQNLAIEREGAREAVRVWTVALWLFAAIAALAAAVFITVLASRQIRSLEKDQETLAALGMSRSHRVLATPAPALPMAIGGAVLAVIGAALASGLFPFGVARKAEPDLGIKLD